MIVPVLRDVYVQTCRARLRHFGGGRDIRECSREVATSTAWEVQSEAASLLGLFTAIALARNQFVGSLRLIVGTGAFLLIAHEIRGTARGNAGSITFLSERSSLPMGKLAQRRRPIKSGSSQL